MGVDVVAVPRFAELVRRRPAVLDRLFTSSERTLADGRERTLASLAARFAAKEAVAKALGAPAGLAWHDCVVSVDDAGGPRVDVRGSVAEAATRIGARRWHLSLSHDGDVAIAHVVAEGVSA